MCRLSYRLSRDAVPLLRAHVLQLSGLRRELLRLLLPQARHAEEGLAQGDPTPQLQDLQDFRHLHPPLRGMVHHQRRHGHSAAGRQRLHASVLQTETGRKRATHPFSERLSRVSSLSCFISSY